MSINRNKVLKAAQKHIRKRSWDKALREYQKLVDDDPEDMRSLLKCGDLFVKLNQISEALEAYKSVADYYAQQDMYEKAIAVYKQAQRLDDEDIALHHAIGECYYRLGRLKDAVRSFHQAQRMYKAAGQFDLQREMLEHMVRIDPDDVGLRIQLAERYTKDGLKERALESFAFCAVILEQEGRHDELLQVLERTLFLAPERQDYRKQAVRLYLNRGDNQTALKHLQICFRELPGDMETMELLAQAFERVGKEDKAVLVLQELGPRYREAGRSADAENLYRRILRLDPDNGIAQEALGARGPDSGVITGPANTGPYEGRQHTPAPAGEELDGVEFLDDEVEFLDDDVEFIDDGVEFLDEEVRVAEAAALAPHDAPQSAPQGAPAGIDDDILDLTDDIELIGEAPAPAGLGAEGLGGLSQTEAVDDAAHDASDTSDVGSDESDIRSMLSECDVFLKYGLYDKATDAISRALEASPKSVYAHEKLLALQQVTGNKGDEYRTLITLAELTQEQPLLAYDYLKQALEVAPNPQAVHVRAQALGINLNGPPPTDSLVEISAASIQAVPLDSDDDLLDDDLLDIAFLDPDDALVDDDLGQALDELDIDFHETGLAIETDSEIVADDELAIDGVDIVEMDLDADSEGFDERALDALQDVPYDPAQAEESFDRLFEGIEADDIFDDLFGDADDGASINLGGDDPMGELAEIDFFIQQGLTEEAQEALQNFAAANPLHPGLDKRRNQLHQVRTGLSVDDNPFGARSLSQKFNPSIEGHISEAELVHFDSVVNSNLELGTAYRDMGLLNEAIEEFRQALDDPEASASAQFHIALCQIDLGHSADARTTLRQLLERNDLTTQVQQTVRQKLDELEARAS